MALAGEPVFVGVDVGTGSARAGVFDVRGRLLGSAKHAIALWRDAGEIVEQSSDDIWRVVSATVRAAVADAGNTPEAVAGVGFDATCSLVALDGRDRPLGVSGSGDASRNIIVWMDHRAVNQAERINATRHRVLSYVGGVISPEMETPKLLWLKENLPEAYARAAHFFDLADYLTWRATGDEARSVCTVTCKWTYLAHEKRWDDSYFHAVGLGDLVEDGYSRIGRKVVEAGSPLGRGLTAVAARDLGLPVGTPVGAGLIDAHAGGIGTVGAAGPGGTAERRMAYVFGTSACTMTSSQNEIFVPGVWGPYYSAMVPGLWLSEGGQSAAGEAIAHLVKLHPNYSRAQAAAEAGGLDVPEYLLRRAEAVVATPSEAIFLAGSVVVVPEFLGNRAPHADPAARAVISGLDLGIDEMSHVALYIAGLAGLGYGLRQILSAQAEAGLKPDTVVISGGAARSRLVKQVLADATGVAVAQPETDEPVLLGSAMLGAVAAGAYATLPDAMAGMSSLGEIFMPADGAVAASHAARFAAFEAFQEAARHMRIDPVRSLTRHG